MARVQGKLSRYCDRFDERLSAIPSPQLPIIYTCEFEDTYWVDPTTGILIDISKNDIRKGTVVVPGASLDAPPIEACSLTYQATPESLAATVDDARSHGNRPKLGRTTGPIRLFVLAA